MATISSTIQLYDKVTAPINRILGALDNMVGMFESVDSAMDRGFDPSVIADTRREIDLATQEMKEFGTATKKAEENTDKLTSSITSMVGAYVGFQSLKKVVDLSDAYVQTEARLKMIVDEHNTIDSLQDKIYASAQKTRASYSDTADMVAKLSMRTNGLFSNDEAIVFAENLNKLYTIAGASQEEMKSSQLQLLQAMGSGVLRGEEFNAVYEAAPNIMHQVAESMGTPIEKLREMAADGQITADIVKRALLTIPEETLNEFEKMPMTWGQVWTTFMNKIYRASEPVLKAISFLAQNWSILEPIVIGVASALAVYLAVTKGVELATKAWAAAQAFFNSVMALNPIYIIIMAVILLISLIYAIVAAINKVTGKSISATGIIVGVLATAGAFVGNLFLGLLDLVLGIVNIFWNRFAMFANFFANLFNDPIGSIIHLFGDMADSILGILETIASAMDKIFGSNMAGAVQGWRSGLNSMVETAANKYGNGSYEKVVDELNMTSETFGLNRIAYGDAYKAGYNWGSNLGGSTAEALIDSSALTAKNTEKIADSLDITNEDLKYLKDLAERDVINRFTTAEIKVDMTNNNNIGGNMDLDGIVEYLVIGVNEAMATAAEGVHG